MTDRQGPAPGRECGECTACCVDLKIDDPALQKEAGVACPHMIEHGGCAIYAHRPGTCSAWYCGWRYLPQLSDDWRPDRSGVLISFVACEEAGYPASALKIAVKQTDAALKPQVLDFIAQSLARGIGVYFVHTGGIGPAFKTFLNARLGQKGQAGLAGIIAIIANEQLALKQGRATLD